MTEKQMPQTGERVRAIIEGEVTTSDDFNAEFFVKTEAGGGNWVNLKAATSIERIGPALPTARGSVVQMSLGGRKDMRLLLTRDGYWVDERGDTLQPPFAIDRVIFDAGAS